MTTYQYSGSGYIFETSTLDGKRSFSYNTSSISENNIEDYQSISGSFTSFDDYGEVNDVTGSVTDYNLITELVTDTITPFGGLTISGSAITQPNYRLYFSGASVEKVIYSPDNLGGSLFSFGEKVERRSYSYNESSSENTEEDYGFVSETPTLSDDYGNFGVSGSTQDYGLTTESTGGVITPFGGLTISGSAITQPNYRLYFSGASVEKVIYSPDNLGGSLFSFGEKVEKITFSYNDSSSYSDTDDYGFITSAYSESNDYGLITETGGTQPEQNYGLITEVIFGSPILPFGSLSISGSAITAEFNTYTKIGSGLINISGIAEDSFAVNISDSTQLFQITGTSSNSQNNTYIASGSLFSFGEKIERRSYSYNESSLITSTPEDYQFINDSATEFSDFGFIDSEPDDGIDNYGRIGGVFGPPFGSIFISGVSSISFDKGPYSANGSLIFSGSAVEKFTADTPDNTQLFQINGNALDSSINVHIGIGTLFNFGEKLESITYDYSESSIVDTQNDYGSITETNPQQVDYGFISEIGGTQPEENYGLVTEIISSQFITPFGSLSILGSAITAEFNTYTKIGSGSITIAGTAVEKFAVALDNTQLFQINGNALDSSINVHIGIGTLFNFGEKLESVTYDYNESSVSIYESLDYQSITSSPDESYDDYGLIVNVFSITEDYGVISGFGATETLYPFGSLVISGFSSEKNVDSYSGLGTIFISSQASIVEIESYNGSGTIFVSGSVVEKDVDSYVGVGTLTISASAFESEVELYTGSGTITLSGIATERVTFNPPENNQLFTIFGTAVKKDIDSYVGVGTIFISGELVHPNIDYTPHYGIEKNIGIGTTGIQLSGSAFDAYSAQTPENTQLFQISGIATESITFNPPENNQLFTFFGTAVEKDIDSYVGVGTIFISGTLVEKNTESYVGLGTITVSGTALESLSAQTPENTILYAFSGTADKSDVDSYVGVGTAFIDVSSRNYSPVYPRNSGDVGSGIGTIRINDDSGLTITRAVLPYFARGGLVLSGIGVESFSITNYDGSGVTTLSGVSSTREIAVYTAVGLGTITLSDVSVQRIVDSYQSSGVIHLGKYEIRTQSLGDSSLTFDNDTVGFDNVTSQFVYSEARTTETDAYRGSGRINALSGSANAFALQSTTNIQLFTISGSAADAYSAQTPETEVLYQFSGNITESRTYGYEGSGQATFGSAALPIFEPRVFGTGLIRFATYLSDNLYDTCDSTDLTSDHQISAFVKFVTNPPENTVLYNFYGDASTEQTQIYTYTGFSSVGISGSHVIRKTKSVVGIGTLTITSTAGKKDIDSYVGSGSIAILSGSSESRVSTIPQSTVLFEISGDSSTRTFAVYTYSGIGTAYFSGSASTKVLSSRSYSGVGTIYLSGELVHPDIRFVPVAKGLGTININGSGLEKIQYNYLPIPQSLFVFSGGFESFTESTYVGVGTIYIDPISGITINNPYQSPRTYVVII